ncbi:HAMP domain-containing histidine kinase [Candidatus Saccharibacteria bacterium]|nr:HAMP domain-containing histidine kinase [Candidatus Saccharibacteria bacterium]
MFKKLRNKLILINVGITTVVLVVAFSAVYFVSTHTANNRPPVPSEVTMQETTNGVDINKIITFTIREEKQAAARDLLVMLIVSGIVVDVAVLFVSYLLAEQAIKPVREAYEAQKIFIANASHEIKTPLAAISANLEAADIHDNKWIDNVVIEADKLAALNGELLTLARTDLMTERHTEEVDVSEIVQVSLTRFNPRMKNLKLTKKIIKNEKAKINREDFVQIISCLMDNAVKYAGTKIRVELQPHRLTIANDGATISDQALPHIFERFYQADKTAEGVGLGLSIAKNLADRNGWDLSAKSDKLTEFALSF